MVLRVRNRVMRRGRGYEVRWNEFGALMYELIEGVLAIGASCAPDDWLEEYA